MLPNWRIFYADGGEYDDLEGRRLEGAPREGFICAVGYDEAGKRYIMHGWDFYRFDGLTQQWWGMDIFGVLTWANKIKIIDKIVPGRVTIFRNRERDFDLIGLVAYLKTDHCMFEGETLSRSDWNRIMARADAAAEFPIGGRK